MKKFAIGLLTVLFSFSAVSAEGGYLGFGFGILPDALGLGTTIASSGLQTSVNNPDLTTSNGANGQACVLTNNCPMATTPSGQALWIAEPTLIGLEKMTLMGISADETNGPITLWDLSVFWENESEASFWRVGVAFNQKLMGGFSKSSIGTIPWYQMNYDVRSFRIPVYFGFKAGVGEASSVYGGGGVNYFKGTATIGGFNIGALPTFVLGQAVGMNTVLNADGLPVSGAVTGETFNLTSEGLGFNFMIGGETKLESGSKVFFEIEHILAAAYGRDSAKTIAVATALSPKIPVYTVMGGTVYKFGYKMPM